MVFSRVMVVVLGLLLGLSRLGFAEEASSSAIPWSEIGARATADYQGDGLSVVTSDDGAILKCVFQRLEGEATPEGLWLTSTASDESRDRFRVVARDVNGAALPATGSVSVHDGVVQFLRAGLVEEYSTSIDGVRQDFVVLEKPQSADGLRVGLKVDGATVLGAGDGAQIILNESGRKLSYSRLRVTDAEGKELSARLEVGESFAARAPRPAREARALPGEEDSNYAVTEEARALSGINSKSEIRDSQFDMAVVVDDANAVYPVRIDPTFSDANWSGFSGDIGANGRVYAIAADRKGRVYVGGEFTRVGDVEANRIAMWDGLGWRALGSGVTNALDNIAAIAVSENFVYAGGTFKKMGGVAADRVARWDGSAWSSLGGATLEGFGNVTLLAVPTGDQLFVGGNFNGVAGVTNTKGFAKWNGTNWVSVGGGVRGGGGVYGVAFASTNVFYVVGSFTNLGGTTVSGVAKWDGSNWLALGDGVDFVTGDPALGDYASTITFHGTNLFIGGAFRSVSGVAKTVGVAVWNGSGWSAVGEGLTNSGAIRAYVGALVSHNGVLYAGGRFTHSGSDAARYIARWDGDVWEEIGGGVSSGSNPSSVSALAVAGDQLWVGGSFTVAGARRARNLASWGIEGWVSAAQITNTVYAAVVAEDALYIGGSFTTIGDKLFNRVAKWDGASWSDLDGGMNNLVRSLAFDGGALYAAGDFTQAGGSAARRIAKWNGTSWSEVGGGVTGGIAYAVAASAGSVYVGGYFTNAGGTAVFGIARWDGGSWSTMGGGVVGSGGVLSLVATGATVYAGGAFTNMAGVAKTVGIAKWNGSSWTNLKGGVAGAVYALGLTGGTNLYVGGEFNAVDSAEMHNIARWDGAGWWNLGDGVDGRVQAIAAAGSDVYVGGAFESAGGKAARATAHWDGVAWHSMGAGPRWAATALAVFDGEVYAGSLSGEDAPTLSKWGGNHWRALSSVGPDNGAVEAIAVYGNDVVIGGGFTSIGGSASYKYLARWDGQYWNALGSGVNGDVTALETVGDVLYVGGAFDQAGGSWSPGIAAWRQSFGWASLNGGVQGGGQVWALKAVGSDLYAGGTFTNIGGVGVRRIARWDGTAWHALGGGVTGISGGYDVAMVYALLAAGSDLYVGGSFTAAGGNAATNVALWDGAAWHALDKGVKGGPVHALQMWQGNLYAGGEFKASNGAPANFLVQWDGSTWKAVGFPSDLISALGGVFVLAASEHALYVGGDFSVNGLYGAKNIVRWDGRNWAAAKGNANGGVYALHAAENTVYAGGDFERIGQASAKRAAKLGMDDWIVAGGGADAAVKSVALGNGAVYIGGDFTRVGSVTAKRVAQWTGTNWAAMADGFNAPALALAIFQGDLYAGGLFNMSGALPVNYIARWDGNVWQAMGSGANAAVDALAASDNWLIAGGRFTTMDQIGAMNYIARWDGSSWAKMLPGFDDAVYTVAITAGDVVYAGGKFITVAGSPTPVLNRIAKWDGSVWSALGTGVNSSVFAVIARSNEVFVGGDFISADGMTANRIARWDGGAWHTLGDGLNAPVRALAFAGKDVVAGGDFTMAGRQPASFIARWNGQGWSALGSGLDDRALALASSGRSVFVGGDFTKAGGQPFAHIARAYIPLELYLTGFMQGNNLVLEWDEPSGILQVAPEVTGPYSDVSGAVSPFTTNKPGKAREFYRLHD